MRRTVLRACVVAVVGSLVGATAAQAATKDVSAGPPRHPTVRQADYDQFFRTTITIHVGDTVRWAFNGLHTVTFPGPQPPPPFVAPNPADPITGQRDAGGNPFWFNRHPNLEIGPQAAFRTNGSTYDGTTYRNSGLPVPKPTPYTLRFTRAGTFHYICLVHPGMGGTVKVVAQGRSVPSATQDRRASDAQFAHDERTARTLARQRPARNSVIVGPSRGTVFLATFASPVTHVNVGGTLTFAMPSDTSEIHTVTFGPTRYTSKLEKDFVVVKPKPNGPPTIGLNPVAGYSSHPPPGLPAYTGHNHGNGFENSGIMDSDPRSPMPQRIQIRFTRAGTFHYECVVHPGMDGTIVVAAHHHRRSLPRFTG